MATGKEVKDPFYKNTWFKRAATTAAIGIPLLAANLARSGERKQADGRRPSTGTDYGDKVDRLTHSAADGKRKLYNKLGLAARIKNPILLQAVVRHVEFMKVVGGGYRPPVMGTLPDTEPLANAIYVAPEISLSVAVVSRPKAPASPESAAISKSTDVRLTHRAPTMPLPDLIPLKIQSPISRRPKIGFLAVTERNRINVAPKRLTNAVS